jgi:hypothetical protein
VLIGGASKSYSGKKKFISKNRFFPGTRPGHNLLYAADNLPRDCNWGLGEVCHMADALGEGTGKACG